MSVGFKSDRVLAIAESGLDALSYLVARGSDGVRVASISGKMNPAQPTMIQSAIGRMEEGARIVAAFDNDKGGDELTQQLMDIVQSTGRSDLEFADDRPIARGADWNKVVVEEAVKAGLMQAPSPTFGR